MNRVDPPGRRVETALPTRVTAPGDDPERSCPRCKRRVHAPRPRPAGGHLEQDGPPPRAALLLAVVAMLVAVSSAAASGTTALSLNGPDALAAFDAAWNPLGTGSTIVLPADTVAAGAFDYRLYLYGIVDLWRWNGNDATASLPRGFHQSQFLTLAALYYGLTPNTELDLWPSLLTTSSRVNGRTVTGTGLNDLALGIKHRFVVQDSDSLRPSLSAALLTSLPLSSWAGTPADRGLFFPISILPTTHLGTYGLTGILMAAKNFRPLRLSADLYYTFTVPQSSLPPGSRPSTIQYGDVLSWRGGIEYLPDNRYGFGLVLGACGVTGLPFSVDGRRVNSSPAAFQLFGIQPGVELNTGGLSVFAGVLPTIEGISANGFVEATASVTYRW